MVDILTRCSPESTSSRDMRLWPSRRSSNRSPTCLLACNKSLKILVSLSIVLWQQILGFLLHKPQKYKHINQHSGPQLVYVHLCGCIYLTQGEIIKNNIHNRPKKARKFRAVRALARSGILVLVMFVAVTKQWKCPKIIYIIKKKKKQHK